MLKAGRKGRLGRRLGRPRASRRQSPGLAWNFRESVTLARSIRLQQGWRRQVRRSRPGCTDDVFYGWFRHQKMEIVDFNALSR